MNYVEQGRSEESNFCVHLGYNKLKYSVHG